MKFHQGFLLIEQTIRSSFRVSFHPNSHISKHKPSEFYQICETLNSKKTLKNRQHTPAPFMLLLSIKILTSIRFNENLKITKNIISRKHKDVQLNLH